MPNLTCKAANHRLVAGFAHALCMLRMTPQKFQKMDVREHFRRVINLCSARRLQMPTQPD